MKYQILQGDNFSALYADGKKVLELHTLDPEYVIEVITGEMPEVVEEWELDEDVEELWVNGIGYPEEWPFE